MKHHNVLHAHLQVLEMGRLVDENKVLVGRLGQVESDLR
jgi:hypothetical protein